MEIPYTRDKALNALSVYRKNWKTTLHFWFDAGEWFCVPLQWCAVIFPVIRLQFVKLMLTVLLWCLWSKAVLRLNSNKMKNKSNHIFSAHFMRTCGSLGGRYLYIPSALDQIYFSMFFIFFGFAATFLQDIKGTWLNSIKNEIQNECCMQNDIQGSICQSP